jgi:hypothetical protein
VPAELQAVSTRRCRRVLGATALTLAVLAAACGGGDSESSSPTTTAAPSEPDVATLPAWATRVCVGIGTWNEAMLHLRDAVTAPATAADVAATRDALAAALDTAVAATDTLLTELRKTGDAPTEGGAEASERLRTAYTDARSALETAATDAAALPVDSIEAFTAARDALATTTVQGLIAAGAKLDDAADLPALDEALAASPACPVLA